MDYTMNDIDTDGDEDVEVFQQQQDDISHPTASTELKIDTTEGEEEVKKESLQKDDMESITTSSTEPPANKRSFLRAIRKSLSFGGAGANNNFEVNDDTLSDLPDGGPSLKSSITDPNLGFRSPVKQKSFLLKKTKSSTALDRSVKLTRRQSGTVSPMKRAANLTVNDIENVSCVFKVTVDRIIFPENKGYSGKLREGVNLQVIFERGDRNVKSYERPVTLNEDNGCMEAVFDESLSISLTMYRNPSTNKYLEKKGKLTIMQEKRKTKMKRLFTQPYKEIGTVQFDLAKYFDEYVSSDKVLGVTNCPIPGTNIHVTLQPKIIGENMAQFTKPRVDKEKGEEYVGEYLKDKKHGQGRMKFGDGSSYHGEWRDDMMHGKGRYETSDGEVYDGYFMNGLKHGRGHTSFSDGSFFAGDYNDGVVSGEGKFIADGDIYEGHWEDNMQNGKGKLIYASGAVYEGDFVDDTKEGTGVLTTNHGDRYIGSFKCDAYHGDGTLTWAAGDEYIGSWANGKMNGYGMYKWKNGDVYRGMWRDNMKHGEGEFTADNGNGDSFKGIFEDDKKKKGVYKFASGDVYEGEYVDDMQEGEGCLTYSNGDRYEGTFERDMRHGSGAFKFANGSAYVGEYYEDRIEGVGKYESHMGDTYDGEYLNNCRHGYGKYSYHDGSYYEGHWQNNMKHGEGFYMWPNGNTFTGEFIEDKKSNKGKYSIVYRVK